MCNWKFLIMVPALLAGCAVDQPMFRPMRTAETARIEQERAQYLRDQAYLEARATAERAERKRLEEEAAKRRQTEKEVARMEWVQKHRANGGFLVHEMGPVCLYRQKSTNDSGLEGLINMFTPPKCQLYSEDRALIEASYLNDTQVQVKDLKVKCVLIAPSGTHLGGYYAATIYEKWEPGEMKMFEVEVPLRRQAKTAKCVRG